MSIIYDYIIIGAGSTGCVMAARLSENSQNQVLLLEAGPDFKTDDLIPEKLLNSNLVVTSGYNWDMKAQINEDSINSKTLRVANVFAAASDRLAMANATVKNLLKKNNVITQFQFPMAKVIGGGSSINGALAFAANSTDYQQWVDAGNDGWGWSQSKVYHELLNDPQRPYYKPVEKIEKINFTQAQNAFYHACLDCGYNEVNLDSNEMQGVGTIGKSTKNGLRYSNAQAYLSPARNRPNLSIVADALVDKITFDQSAEGLSAKSIEVEIEGQKQQFFARHIILSAGSVNSPAILMRSGIGPRNTLNKAGIRTLLDLQGVGQSLSDHASVSLWFEPEDNVVQSGEALHQAILRTESDENQPGDLQLYMLSGIETKQFPPLEDFIKSKLALGVSVVLTRPKSRGYVAITSKDAHQNPKIILNCASDADDLRRFMIGVRKAWEIVQSNHFKKLTKKVVMWNQKIIESDELLKKMIKTIVRPTWHPVGTLPMGKKHDPMAVTNQFGRLYGCDNLTVADASVMPSIPRVPTNHMCTVIGERTADHLLEVI